MSHQAAGGRFRRFPVGLSGMRVWIKGTEKHSFGFMIGVLPELHYVGYHRGTDFPMGWCRFGQSQSTRSQVPNEPASKAAQEHDKRDGHSKSEHRHRRSKRRSKESSDPQSKSKPRTETAQSSRSQKPTADSSKDTGQPSDPLQSQEDTARSSKTPAKTAPSEGMAAVGAPAWDFSNVRQTLESVPLEKERSPDDDDDPPVLQFKISAQTQTTSKRRRRTAKGPDSQEAEATVPARGEDGVIKKKHKRRRRSST